MNLEFMTEKDARNLDVGDTYWRSDFTLNSKDTNEIIAVYDVIPRVGRFRHGYYEISTPEDGTHKLIIFKSSSGNEACLSIEKRCKGYNLIVNLL